MKRREILAEAQTPDGKPMVLWERAGDTFIEVAGAVLMSTRGTASEQALAQRVAREVAHRRCPRVLIGGLGMGFTLGAALDALPSDASVVVVEWMAAVVEWYRRYRFESATDRLADPRVVLEEQDVVEVMRRAAQCFDAILLDVDNGPEALSNAGNSRLYSVRGLARIRQALAPGGVLAVWSAQRSFAFEHRLAAASFGVTVESARSQGQRGERHTIYLARAPG